MDTDVAVVGAGPYGLSISAHLTHKGVATRTYGVPMATWKNNMPAGMLLKSDGFASSLAAPVDGWTLGEHSERTGVVYGDREPRVTLDQFADYALDFQRHFVPELDTRLVSRLTAEDRGYALDFGDGETVTARRVVIAVGISHFAYVPDLFSELGDHVTHSGAHRTFDEFAGKHVAVIGAGSSAVEVSAALVDAGAHVHLIARRAEIPFWNVPRPEDLHPSLWMRVRNPSSGLGPGLRSKLCEELPDAYRHLPSDFRLEVLRKHLGPVSPWWLRDTVMNNADVRTRTTPTGARVEDGRVILTLESPDAGESALEVDHVICATGYAANIDKLAFLDPAVAGSIRRVGAMPMLSHHFESSMPGLYFAGAAAAGTFGPLLRFVVGTEFTSPRIAAHLGRRSGGASASRT
ncbi:NAD(P)-binding domain-containing protein [Planctomonas sp. JC2975]|uniref:NAD(P)-binding domain-containing protein n=1 Tax=Planctomonas sp. JC2975 TaxID=2729626 RepID=UPI001473E400|nr:FAD-dependent oxidoreductase [Planctomonas sp. JC2975]NNC11874.1 NAD(P)-binding domain-containing protein [Planctomonas sp. JC2975]